MDKHIQKLEEAQSAELEAFKQKQATDLKELIQETLIKQAAELRAFEQKLEAELKAAKDEIEARLAAMRASVDAHDAYYRDRPPPKPLSEEVRTAMRRPEVEGARVAFLEYVREVTGDALIPTNYYDQVLSVALSCVVASSSSPESPAYSASGERALKLVELYCAFVDALLPYQPDAESLPPPDAPRLPWESDAGAASSAASGKVFYYCEGIGGYWVDDGRELRSAIEAAVEAAAAGNGKGNDNDKGTGTASDGIIICAQ